METKPPLPEFQASGWQSLVLSGRDRSLRFLRILAVGGMAAVTVSQANAADRQRLSGHIPAAVAALRPVGGLPASKHLRLAVGLPLRNQDDLDRLLKDLQDPASPEFHRYLTTEQFAERFGPTREDYQAATDFAITKGLTVTAVHSNRLILDVEGAVTDIENAFHLTLRTYRHPLENRVFFAPDSEPSLDLEVPVLHVGGLDDYAIRRPRMRQVPAGRSGGIRPMTGSAPGGSFGGGDFRAAYLPGCSLTGTGQSVALLQFDGYYASDITAYRTKFGLPSVRLVNVAVDGGVSSPGDGNSEVCLDIEMAMAMAPGLSNIYVYMAPQDSPWVDLLSRIANDNLAKQISCSWGGGAPDPSAETVFQQMAAQGQSFFNASGDADAFTGFIDFPSDSPNIIQVGGTTLTTSGAGGSYTSETVWNAGDSSGSSGGVSSLYSIPGWQQGTSMTSNQGSAKMRNIPDVALAADNVWVAYHDGSTAATDVFTGTSCAAPLWAGFTALVNQQSVSNGRSTVGFLNPALYTIGNGSTYATNFHDTTSGNNYSSASPSKYAAVAGYDLCTGWGTPKGSALINSLANPYDNLQVSFTAFVATGPAGGSFTPNSAGYTLTNNGTSSLNWTAAKTQPWTTLSATSGTLGPGANVTVTWSLNTSANALAAATYTDTVTFADANTGVAQTRGLALTVVPQHFGIPFAEGFENGGAIPSGWTREYVSGTLPWTFEAGSDTGYPSSAHGGSYNACLYVDDDTLPTTKLVSPPIDFGFSPQNAQLKFWLWMQSWSGDQDQLRVYYKTSAGGTWSLLATYTKNVSSWTQQTVSLPNPNSTYYIAFEGNARYGYGVCIDDVQVTASNPPAVATASPLPADTAGMSYNQTLTATGGSTPYIWGITAGSLPSGLTLTSGGVISGTPAAATTAGFTVQVTGGNSLSSTKDFSLTINPALAVNPTSLPAGTAVTAYHQVATVTGGTTPYTTFTVTGFSGGTTGLTAAAVAANSAAGTVTVDGTPAAAGTVSFTLNVTDTAGATLTKSYSITVAPAVHIPPPTVTSPASSAIGATTATLGGNVTSDGGSAVTERGVVYSITTVNADPVIGGTGVTKVTAAGTTGVFTAPVSGLMVGTGYTFKAYATNTSGTGYTAATAFATFTAAAAFDSWAAAVGLSGPSANATAAPLGDGVPNLLKYAFNMNVSQPDVRVMVPGSGTRGLPSITLRQNGASSVLRFEFVRRIGSGLVYTPQMSVDLAASSWLSGSNSPTVTPIDGTWERAVYEGPVSTPQCFGRVMVTMP